MFVNEPCHGICDLMGGRDNAAGSAMEVNCSLIGNADFHVFDHLPKIHFKDKDMLDPNDQAYP